MSSKNIIFFDSECISCNRFAKFILAKSKHDNIYFSSLNSSQKIQIIDLPNYDELHDTIYFLKGEKLYSKSKAIFYIMKELKHPFFILSILRFLPTRITDFFYDIYARKRKIIISCELNSETFNNKILK
jgi:predicted DCC family thiol-disulfide oxidoreductase YuxK